MMILTICPVKVCMDKSNAVIISSSTHMKRNMPLMKMANLV